MGVFFRRATFGATFEAWRRPSEAWRRSIPPTPTWCTTPPSTTTERDSQQPPRTAWSKSSTSRATKRKRRRTSLTSQDTTDPSVSGVGTPQVRTNRRVVFVRQARARLEGKRTAARGVHAGVLAHAPRLCECRRIRTARVWTRSRLRLQRRKRLRAHVQAGGERVGCREHTGRALHRL